jgi:anti-sigma regulatory factor (Ser/Thr protein kinase)
MTRLVPKPHMLKAVRARNSSLSAAIYELGDNSLDHGRASMLTIIIDNAAGVIVTDDGIGIDDINRLFRFGDASAYSDLAQIGQYGVGAKNATIWLGDVVTVETVRNNIKHRMSVNWAAVERDGEWPEEYSGKGKAAKKHERGTRITIEKLARHYQLATSEKLAKDFGHIFAPALRRGVRIEVVHKLARGDTQILSVQPFTPADLSEIIAISGTVSTPHGDLPWSGRAGLSASLVDRFNAVHIAFRHRVIEATRDPFQGASAPTLYVEVQLDDTVPWKHQLSEHKDKVVRYRDELMESVHQTIRELLEKSQQQAQNLALKAMTAPVEAQLKKAMRGAGILHHDPQELPEDRGEPDPGLPAETRSKRLVTPKPEGPEAKETPRPTGVKIEYLEPEQLEGKAFGWSLSGKLMVISLDKSMFMPVLGWPIDVRGMHIAHMVVGFVAHGIEMEYWGGKNSLRGVVTRKLSDQIEKWATDEKAIMPYLYREMMEGITFEDVKVAA